MISCDKDGCKSGAQFSAWFPEQLAKVNVRACRAHLPWAVETVLIEDGPPKVTWFDKE